MYHSASVLLLVWLSCAWADNYDNRNILPDRPTMVHLFEWKWTDIKAECKDFLSKYNFGAIQISPPQEDINGSQWWSRYQPVSYKLTSRSGTEAEFQDMVTTCNSYGVRIYVDAVINHMTGAGSTTPARGGSTYSAQPGSESFPAVPYSSSNFNDYRCNGDITNYGDVNNVRNCRLVSLLDLDHGQEAVRANIAAYMNKLIGMGVAGFRVDAAKHMWPGDLENIYGRLNNLKSPDFAPNTKPFIFEETIECGTEGSNAIDYINVGNIINFKYGRYVSDALMQTTSGLSVSPQRFEYFGNFGEAWGMWASGESVVFIDNHDTERSDICGKSVPIHGNPLYKKGVGFMLAHPYGYAQVLSSYYWTDKELGPPAYPVTAAGSGSLPATCPYSTYAWACEQRWRQIYNMAGFRSAVQDNPVTNVAVNAGKNQIAFSRGPKGFFALNNEGSAWTQWFNTGLRGPNSYCDVISGGLSADGTSCTGTEVAVNVDGWAQITVPTGEDGMIAIHDQSRKTSNFKRTVIFVYQPTTTGQDLFALGGVDNSRLAGCTNVASTSKCAIPIRHKTNTPNSFTSHNTWRINDNFLDWYGAEPNQGVFNTVAAIGSPMAWSTNANTEAGYQPLNTFGPHWWMLDVSMDCGSLPSSNNGYFEFKANLKGGSGWETNRNQATCTGTGGGAAPFTSTNHIARCGYLNKFTFNADSCEINTLSANFP